jgi:hypothetical protein
MNGMPLLFGTVNPAKKSEKRISLPFECGNDEVIN